MDTVDYHLDQDSPLAGQPDNINIQLKPHQLASLYRMCMLDRDCGMTMKSAGIQVRSNIAILADLAGYGKTITFLALIENLKHRETQWMPHAKTYINGGYGITFTKDHEHEYVDTTLVVIPDNLVNHWQRHLDEYTELNYELVDAKNYKKILIEDCDLILCPAHYYNKFIKSNGEYFWNRVAFDEADSIYIPNTEPVNARFLWLITATFDNIPKRKNKGFLRDLFRPRMYFDDPIQKYFLPVVVKGIDSFVKRSFIIPEPQLNYIECFTPHFITAVKNHITAYTLELINAGNLNGAIESLGGNIDTDRNIIDLVTRNIKNEILIAESQLSSLEQLQIGADERKARREKIENKLLSLQTRITSLEEAIRDAADTNCPICCDILKHATLVPCCNNMFCAECLLKWMETSTICPMCRGKFDPSGLQTISMNPRETEGSGPPPMQNKINTLLSIIKKGNGRYIIFSGHTESFKEIGRALDYDNLKYGVLSTSLQTENTLAQFRDGQLRIILLNAEHNGAGIEIPEATDVIIYHQMRRSLETQAVARAQRPGRAGQLTVWKLRYSHEYNTF